MKYELNLRNYGYNPQQARDQRGRWSSDGHETSMIKHHAEAATKALSGKDTLGKLRHAATAVAAQAQQHINLHAKNPSVASHATDAGKHLTNLGKLVTNLRISAHKARQGGKDDSAAKAAYEHYNEIHKDLKGALKKGERSGVVAHHGDDASPAQAQGQKAAPSGDQPVPLDHEGSPKDADTLDHLAGGHMARSAELTDAARAPGLKDKEVKGITHLADAHRLLGSAHYFTAGNNLDRAKSIVDEAEAHVSHATQGGLHPTMQRHAHDATAAIGALRARIRQGHAKAPAQAAPAAQSGSHTDLDALAARAPTPVPVASSAPSVTVPADAHNSSGHAAAASTLSARAFDAGDSARTDSMTALRDAHHALGHMQAAVRNGDAARATREGKNASEFLKGVDAKHLDTPEAKAIHAAAKTHLKALKADGAAPATPARPAAPVVSSTPGVTAPADAYDNSGHAAAASTLSARAFDAGDSARTDSMTALRDAHHALGHMRAAVQRGDAARAAREGKNASEFLKGVDAKHLDTPEAKAVHAAAKTHLKALKAGGAAPATPARPATPAAPAAPAAPKAPSEDEANELSDLGTKHNVITGALQHAASQSKNPKVADQLRTARDAHQMLSSAHYFAAGGDDRAHTSLAAAGEHIQKLEGQQPTGQAREALDAAKQAHASLTSRLGGGNDAQRAVHADTATKHHAVAAVLAQGPSRGGADARAQYVAAQNAHATIGHAFQALADGDHKAAGDLAQTAQDHVTTLRGLKPSGVNLKQALSKAQGGLNALRDHLS